MARIKGQLGLPGFLQDPELFLEHNNYEPIDLLILLAAIDCSLLE
jgi:hypothetical protein